MALNIGLQTFAEGASALSDSTCTAFWSWIIKSIVHVSDPDIHPLPMSFLAILDPLSIHLVQIRVLSQNQLMFKPRQEAHDYVDPQTTLPSAVQLSPGDPTILRTFQSFCIIHF